MFVQIGKKKSVHVFKKKNNVKHIKMKKTSNAYFFLFLCIFTFFKC